MFTHSKDISFIGGGRTDLVVLAFIALVTAFIYFLIIQPRRERVRKSAAPTRLELRETDMANGSAPHSDQDATSTSIEASEACAAAMEDSVDLQSLMSAVREQAVELRCEHAKIVSNLSLNFDLLTSRLATIEPLLTKAVEANGKNEASVGLLTVSNDEYKRKLAEAERAVACYRPLAIKLEDDLQIARAQVAEADRKFAALEGDYVKAQGATNELFQKMSSAEMARQRAAEENSALT